MGERSGRSSDTARLDCGGGNDDDDDNDDVMIDEAAVAGEEAEVDKGVAAADRAKLVTLATAIDFSLLCEKTRICCCCCCCFCCNVGFDVSIDEDADSGSDGDDSENAIVERC